MSVKTVEDFFDKHQNWQEELIELRTLLTSFKQLEETIKWGIPTYTVNKKNVIGLGAFKNHYALWFFNGALLKENTDLLINAQEGKTKGLRQIKFYKEEKPDLTVLKKYIEEAIQLQLAGKEIKKTSPKPLQLPDELVKLLMTNKEIELAFNELTKGKQREFATYIKEAKQEKTKQKRLEKITPLIEAGKGLHDKYREKKT